MKRQRKMKKRLLAWIEEHFKGRQWRPNKTFLSEHIVSECELLNANDVDVAASNGKLEASVLSFYDLMSDGLEEVRKSKIV